MLKMMNSKQNNSEAVRARDLEESALHTTMSRLEDSPDSTSSSMMYSQSFYEAYGEQLSPRTSIGSDQEESLTRVSSASSLESSIAHGTRYKLTMKLSARDMMLLRDSWSIMLDEECPPEKLKAFVSKLNAGRALAPGADKKTRRAGPSPAPARVVSDGERERERERPVGAGAPAPAAAGMPRKSKYAVTSCNSLFGAQFLENIIALAPDLARVFPTIRHVAIGVTGVLSIAISNLEDLSVLDTYLIGLGKRHARILGVTADMFEFAGAAFLKTVQERFSVACTPELEETWRRMYSFLANSLLQFGIDPTIENRARDESAVVFQPPELTSSRANSASADGNNSKKQELPLGAGMIAVGGPAGKGGSGLPQRGLGDPIAFSREHRMSVVPAGATLAPSRAAKRPAPPSFAGKRKTEDRDCVIM